jgi:hypothetical protein
VEILMEKKIGYVLMSLAIASLVLAVFAFFFPVQSNFIKGNIEGAMGFTREWYTYSYTVTGGYLLILAAVCCIYAAMQFNQDPKDIKELLFWAGVSTILMVSVYYAGKTLFNSWLPGVPPEVQSALGTPFADYRVAVVRNIPQILSSAFIGAFAVTAVLAALRKRSDGVGKISERVNQ